MEPEFFYGKGHVMKQMGSTGPPPALPLVWCDPRFFPSKYEERMRKFHESVGVAESLLGTAYPIAMETASAAISGLHKEACSLLPETTGSADYEFVIRTILAITALNPTLLDRTSQALETEDCSRKIPSWVWRTMYALKSLQLEFAKAGTEKTVWMMALTEKFRDAA